ncbi:MAG: hypothetical protein U9Q83_07360, partial [Bacteroidota bacterium]|nr:hypothetical protein [Bacteroidota bacterium]
MPKKILVSLVSKQTIPNILFIKQKKAEFDDFIFITTEQMKSFEKTQSICKASNISFFEQNEIEVLEDNVEDITQKISDKYSNTNEYVINI